MINKNPQVTKTQKISVLRKPQKLTFILREYFNLIKFHRKYTEIGHYLSGIKKHTL